MNTKKTGKQRTNYKEFTKIKALYKNNTLKSLKNNIEWVQNFGSVAEMLQNWRVKELATQGQLNKAEALGLSAFKKIIIDRLTQRAKKQIAEFNEKADKIAQSKDISEIKVTIDWVKSRTWGHNPHAEVWAGGQYTTGTASGCGYDKRSAATAQAFNQNFSILKLLYNKWEQALRKGANIRDFVGYGSGYSSPYFEGGVGFESHKRIFENCGAFVTWQETNTADFMLVTWDK